MKHNQLYFTFSLVVISIYLYSCNSSSKSDAQNESASETEEVMEATEEPMEEAPEEMEAEVASPFNDQKNSKSIDVNLKGVYVTSTKMPHSQYSYANLFDGKPTTFWESMKGAGPYEGIMLYFKEPTAINFLRINQKSGGNFAKLEAVEIYTNGSKEGIHSLNNEFIELEAENILSLYIKFERLSDISRTDKFDGEYMRSSFFDKNKSIAITEIEMMHGGNRLNLKAPQILPGSFTASSTLSPNEAYGVQNLMDSHKEFAWVEGAPGLGIGETINVNLDSETEITGILVNNGFQRSERHFKANARVKELKIEDEKGNTNILKLEDKMDEQYINFQQPINGKNITMTINSGFKGTAYEDLVISELKFLQGDKLMVVSNQAQENLKRELIKKSKNTVLQNYLDNAVDFWYGEMDGYSSTFILRSDYTFVSYYKEREGDEVLKETISDGNWEIKELGPDKAVIRVFGKLMNISRTIDYYAGSSEDSYIQIFQDFVTFTNNKIEGEKFIQNHQIVRESNE